MSQKNRDEGWYWVKFRGYWKINRWVNAPNGNGFFVESNGDFSASEIFMDEIDERRITREEQKS